MTRAGLKLRTVAATHCCCLRTGSVARSGAADWSRGQELRRRRRRREWLARVCLRSVDAHAVAAVGGEDRDSGEAAQKQQAARVVAGCVH